MLTEPANKGSPPGADPGLRAKQSPTAGGAPRPHPTPNPKHLPVLEKMFRNICTWRNVSVTRRQIASWTRLSPSQDALEKSVTATRPCSAPTLKMRSLRVRVCTAGYMYWTLKGLTQFWVHRSTLSLTHHRERAVHRALTVSAPSHRSGMQRGATARTQQHRRSQIEDVGGKRTGKSTSRLKK